MANKRQSEYTIELDIKYGDETRRKVDDIERSFQDISKAAKDGISDGLKTAASLADELSKNIQDAARSESGAVKQLEAFEKASNKTIKALEKQSTDLTHSLSEQGKAQRERLVELQKELATLGKTKEEKQRKKEIDKEIKAIQKDVIVGTDKELKTALENNRAIRARLKLAQQNTKLLSAEAKEEKTLAGYFRDDLKAIREKIKAQFKFIEALKTTEGRYKAIKKAASLVGSGVKAAAKGAGVLGAGLIGGAIAMGGAAVSQAGSMVEREREASRIKASISDDEKQALLGELYIRTGADYTSIVDAINRVTSVLGIHNRDEIAQAAAIEIRYPGAAAMFRQQNTGSVTSKDFNVFANRQKAIQAATGATTEQITAATDKIANMRQRSFSNASMTDLEAVYLTLQNSGAYDSQDELDRAFRGFVRAQSQQKDNAFDFAKKYFSGSGAGRGVYGATNKQQAMQALSQVDWRTVSKSVRDRDFTTPTQTAAEKTAQKMREFEEKKNEILMKLVEALLPVIEAIKPDELTAFFSSMIDLVKMLAPAISEIVTFITSTMTKLIQSVVAMYEGLKNSKLGKLMLGLENDGDWFTEHAKHISGAYESNGGLASMPSIAGEAGPEMVVPLDYSRNARGNQLTQNLVQYFNMSGSETTTLSLSQAVKSRDFTRAMMSNQYLSGRLGR